MCASLITHYSLSGLLHGSVVIACGFATRIPVVIVRILVVIVCIYLYQVVAFG
jgi:hypothetical protein